MANSRKKLMIDLSETYSNEIPRFDNPKICGYFSISQDREYIPDSRNLLYYYPRYGELRLNLNQGLRLPGKRDIDFDMDENLTHVLKYLVNNKQSLLAKGSGRLLDFDFICYSSLLVKIMSSFHLKEYWTVYVTKWKGTFYLCEANKTGLLDMDRTLQSKYISWGLKFEQYMLTDTVGQAPDTSRPVQECEEFYSVYQSKLNSHKILYASGIDGILNSDEIDRLNPDLNKVQFMELKTSSLVANERTDRNLLHYKFIKWWLQCHFANIKTLFCGFRDRGGYVHKVYEYNVEEFPVLAKNYWDWKSCLNFGNNFLNIVKESIPEDTDDPYTVWKFEWSPGEDDDLFTYNIFKGPSRHTFLPGWYIKDMTGNS